MTPTVPDYRGASLVGIMPELLGHGVGSHGFPVDLDPGTPTVLVVLDGLGWEQLIERWSLAPTLQSMSGGPITSVAPSTTATALTSLTTGLTPAEHGIVGYRMVVQGEVLNTLRWGTQQHPDVRRTLPPEDLQPYDPFLGGSLPLVTRSEFSTSGFSRAHLRGGRFAGYRTLGTLVSEVGRLLREGEPLVYTYYDGIDKVSHEYGLGATYDAELANADRLVAAIIDGAPSGVRVLVTADHGQVDCGQGSRPPVPTAGELVVGLSGEGRFRWLHARRGAEAELLAAAHEAHDAQAWVRSLDQILEEGWFGAAMQPEIRRRLGDVALLPFEPISFTDPADTGPYELVGRHGSLTSAEMFVPLVSCVT